MGWKIFFGFIKIFLINKKEIIFLFNGYYQTFLFFIYNFFFGFIMIKYLMDFYYNLI